MLGYCNKLLKFKYIINVVLLDKNFSKFILYFVNFIFCCTYLFLKITLQLNTFFSTIFPIKALMPTRSTIKCGYLSRKTSFTSQYKQLIRHNDTRCHRFMCSKYFEITNFSLLCTKVRFAKNIFKVYPCKKYFA